MAWDIANAAYVSFKDVSAQDTGPMGVAFSPDGTKMFVQGYSTDSVYRYDLSTAWDVTSASYVSTKAVSAQDGSPWDVVFSGDGTKMFIIGWANGSVYRYDLSTAWDITSAAYVSLKSVSAQDTQPTGVTFSPDGTKMFVIGRNSDGVHRYDLSTAWDVTSATYVSLKDISVQERDPRDVTFSGDGSKMFVLGTANKSAYRYDLSTAWDITTATYVSLKVVSAQDTNPNGFTFSGDGTIMFVSGYGTNKIYRYDIPPPTFTGTVAWTETDDTAAATGTHVPLFTGTAAWTEQDDGWAATGTHVPPAFTGDVAWTEADDTATGAGTATAPVYTGTVAWTEAADGWTLTTAPPPPTPPERTYTVAADNRTYTVQSESRTLTVPAEARTLEVAL